tara:strand:+ start:17098 stop:17982 length:885 start_codon:yes stop_codon:yes gene_type:complete
MLGLVALGIARAQEIPIEGLEMGQSEGVATAAIDAACGGVARIEVAPTQFPAASESEVHLRCAALTLADGRAGGGAIFTFADDKLVLIHTRGQADNLRPEAEPVAQFEDFDVYMPHRIIVNPETGQSAVFGEFPIVPLAFHWDNPAWTSDTISPTNTEFFLPPEIVFGNSLAEMTEILNEACALAVGRSVDKIWLATAPAAQFQIDCYGYEIAGYPRKLEFVFGDETLQQVWLMFDTGDIPRLREFLTVNYGDPISVDDQYEIFDEGHLALRKDIPEIRMVSDEIAEIFATASE